MDYKYRFSIVIPTRNRPETLRFCLEACLAQRDFENYEIVINDNSDGEDSERLVARIAAVTPRAQRMIKYHRRSEVCSMSRNFEDAIDRAAGEYVIVIGDDDGLAPMALRELDLLVQQTGAAVIRWKNGLYTWPDLTFQDSGNYLGFSLTRNMHVLDGFEELSKSMETMSYYDLPMLYTNSAVRKHVVDLVRDSDGRLFRSRTPGVYSAMTLAYVCGQYLDVSVPLSLAGLSAASTGISTVFGGDNPGPRIDFRELNAKDGVLLHPHAPNLAIFPFVDFADSFYWAKAHFYPVDASLELPRRRVMEACVARAAVGAPLIREELMKACADDPGLSALVNDLISRQTTRLSAPRVRPDKLGADGVNLHLDGADFGLATIKDAVDLVHKIVWPKDAPLRYDLA